MDFGGRKNRNPDDRSRAGPPPNSQKHKTKTKNGDRRQEVASSQGSSSHTAHPGSGHHGRSDHGRTRARTSLQLENLLPELKPRRNKILIPNPPPKSTSIFPQVPDESLLSPAEREALRHLRAARARLEYRANDEGEHPYIKNPPEIIEKSERRVRVWWYPADFTQTHINGRYEANGKKTGSNACTIICVLMACRLSEPRSKLRIHKLSSRLDPYLVSTFANAISEGNAIHWRKLLNGELAHMNLTVPEAMFAALPSSFHLVEWFYVQKTLTSAMTLRQSLFEQLTAALRRWISPYYIYPRPASHDLYMILIADARSVLIVYQRQHGKLTVIDSHSHLHSGAAMAQVDTHHVKDLCCWYEEVCHTIFGTKPDCYELSCMYVRSESDHEPPTHSYVPELPPEMAFALGGPALGGKLQSGHLCGRENYDGSNFGSAPSPNQRIYPSINGLPVIPSMVPPPAPAVHATIMGIAELYIPPLIPITQPYQGTERNGGRSTFTPPMRPPSGHQNQQATWGWRLPGPVPYSYPPIHPMTAPMFQPYYRYLAYANAHAEVMRVEAICRRMQQYGTSPPNY